MRIIFANEQVRIEANTLQLLVIKYGERIARRIRLRLDEMTAATNLRDLSRLPTTQCSHIVGEKHLITSCTIPPHGIIFSIAKNFDMDVKVLNYSWEKVTLVEIISLGGGVK